MILFIKNISLEGPETLGTFFENLGVETQSIDLGSGQNLPVDLQGIQAVICLGGPMNVFEEEKYPFLKKEDAFIKSVLKQEIPFLGICLGAQLLAKACGARVLKSPKREIGFSTVTFSPEAAKDPLFQGMSGELGVFQWHEDMFTLPEGGVLLATSLEGQIAQAFRVGKRAYGLQFHIEITGRSINDWTDAYWGTADPQLGRKKQLMLDQYEIIKENFNKEANRVYNNFQKLIF